MRVLARSVVVALVIAAALVRAAAQQSPIELACSSATPVVAPTDSISVRAWAEVAPGETLTFRWAATAGEIERDGSMVSWAFASLLRESPQPFRATVRADGANGRSATCTVEVWATTTGRGPGARETGRMLLARNTDTPTGYGLYSYLVFGAGPTTENRSRYEAALEAWWSLVPDLLQLEAYVEKPRLNAMFLAVTEAAPSTVTPTWLLDHSDTARMRAILNAVGRSDEREGPYLISSLEPIGANPVAGNRVLFQDLSHVPPSLAAAWTKEFLNQAAQRRSADDPPAPASLGLRMRTTLRVLAVGLVDVRRGLGEWISWGAALEP